MTKLRNSLRLLLQHRLLLWILCVRHLKLLSVGVAPELRLCNPPNLLLREGDDLVSSGKVHVFVALSQKPSTLKEPEILRQKNLVPSWAVYLTQLTFGAEAFHAGFSVGICAALWAKDKVAILDILALLDLLALLAILLMFFPLL